MTNLTYQEIKKINLLINKINHSIASTKDIQEFLDLIKKSGENNWDQLQNYFNSTKDYSLDRLRRIPDNIRNKEFLDGLVKIGLAVLAVYGISKLFKRK